MVRIDIWQLVDPDLFTDAPLAGVPVAGGQNTTEWAQGDWSIATPIQLDINWLVEETVVDTAADFGVIYDASAGLHRKVLLDNMSPVASNIAMSPTAAIVNKGWDDLTGVVGTVSKPFLTIQGAIDAGANLLHIYDGTYVEDITPTGFQISLTLYNATIAGNIITSIFKIITIQGIWDCYIQWDIWTSWNVILNMSWLASHIWSIFSIFDADIRNIWYIYSYSWLPYASTLSGWGKVSMSNIYNIDISNVLIACWPAAWWLQDVRIRDIGYISCTSLVTGIDEIWTTVHVHDVPVCITSEETFTCAPLNSWALIKIWDCTIITGAALIYWTWTNTINVESYNNTLRRATTWDLIEWTWAAGSRVSIKSQSRISKDWSTTWRSSAIFVDDILNVNV